MSGAVPVEVPSVRSGRRPFTQEEDVRLLELMADKERPDWREVAKEMGGRTARQCRERWMNYMAPVKSAPWSEEEDVLLVEKVSERGKVWSGICGLFGRSANDVKNRWYSHLRYRVKWDENGGKWELCGPEDLGMARKKRNRKRLCPRENACKVLEMQKPPDLPAFENLEWLTDFGPAVPVVDLWEMITGY
jgi:hypothetical protein